MSIVDNDEHKKPGTGDQEARIILKVVGQDGYQLFVTMKRSTQLNKLINAYCDRRTFDLNYCGFLYDGRYLRGDQTPDELEMEDGDEIDAFLRTCPVGLYIDQRNAKTIFQEEEVYRKEEEAYGLLNETRAMLEMEEGDGINAYLHQTEEQRVCFDELIAKDIAREEELIGKEEEVVCNKFRGIIWRFVSKLIAENSVLKDELKRLTLRKDEEEDVVFMKIGRIVHKLVAKNSVPKEELKEKITRLKDELKEELTRIKEELTSILEDDEEDDEGVYEEDDVGAYVEDDEEFIELGRFVSEVVEWGKKNKDVLGCQRSRL